MANKVFLDMDGVLVDFVGGLHKALGVDFNPRKYPYEVSKYDLFDELCESTNGRVSIDNLYRTCDKAEFWANLEWDPMGKEILDTIGRVFDDWDKKICICTSPMAHPDAWKGKVEWINKHLKGIKDISIMTAPKHLLAKSGHMLVDDKDSNINQFVSHGGAGFLIPQPWNSGRAMYDTNYIPALKEFLYTQKRKEEFVCNPCKYLLDSLGL